MRQRTFHGVDATETRIYKAGYNTGYDDAKEDFAKMFNKLKSK